jgi:hypothetical protein
MLLIALPFLDVKRERRVLRRPVAVVAAILTVLSMGVLTYKGATATNEGAPALSAIGATGRDAEAFAEYVADPAAAAGNNVMPKYEGLGEERLRQLGEFLAASKGGE